MSKHTNHPAQLHIKYSGKSDRLSVFFRLFLVLPIAVIFTLLIGSLIQDSQSHSIQIGSGFLFFPIMLMIIIRKKYPKWWFDWVYELTKLSYRIGAYVLLLTDKYPSIDEDQDITLTLKYPNVETDLKQYMPLIKWFLALPHFLILISMFSLVLLLSPIIWLIVLSIKKMPKTLFNFLVGLMRYSLRINAYAVLLITDQYPPFDWKE